MKLTNLNPAAVHPYLFKTNSNDKNLQKDNINTQNKSVLYSNTPFKNSNLLNFGKDTLKKTQKKTKQEPTRSTQTNIDKISKDPDTQNILKRLTKLIGSTKHINPNSRVYGYQNLCKEDKETYKKLIELVELGKVSIYSLRGWSETSFDENYVKSINKYYEALKNGLNDDEIMDLFIPCANSIEDGLNKVEAGEVFETDKTLYYKTRNSKAQKLDLSKDTFFDIFNPIETINQGNCSDCYMLAPIISMLDDIDTRIKIYQCFSEHDGEIKVKLPNSHTFIQTQKGQIFPCNKLDFKDNYAKGSKAVKLLELALEKELTYKKSELVIDKLIKYMKDTKNLSLKDIEFLSGAINDLCKNMTNPRYVIYRYTDKEKELISKGDFPAPFLSNSNTCIGLYDFEKIQKTDFDKTDLFTQDPEIFYRANCGNDFTTYILLGQSVLDGRFDSSCINGIPINSWALSLINNKPQTKFVMSSSCMHQNPASSPPEKFLDYDKGIARYHSYALKTEETPEGKIQYIFKNPHNSARKFILKDEEELKKYFHSIFAMYKKD